MSPQEKLDDIFDWLTSDALCVLVSIDQNDVGVWIIEVWTFDHKVFEIRLAPELVEQLSTEQIAKQVHREYRRTRRLKVPEWAA